MAENVKYMSDIVILDIFLKISDMPFLQKCAIIKLKRARNTILSSIPSIIRHWQFVVKGKYYIRHKGEETVGG